jgi:hypothetical protein
MANMQPYARWDELPGQQHEYRGIKACEGRAYAQDEVACNIYGCVEHSYIHGRQTNDKPGCQTLE